MADENPGGRRNEPKQAPANEGNGNLIAQLADALRQAQSYQPPQAEYRPPAKETIPGGRFKTADGRLVNANGQEIDEEGRVKIASVDQTDPPNWTGYPPGYPGGPPPLPGQLVPPHAAVPAPVR